MKKKKNWPGVGGGSRKVQAIGASKASKNKGNNKSTETLKNHRRPKEDLIMSRSLIPLSE